MAEEEKKIKIISPQEGFQEKFVRSNIDVVFGGGNLGGGKTFASVLAIAEAVLDPNFRAIYVRKNLNDLKTAGGIAETFRECYGDLVSVKLADTPRFTFPSGAWAEGRHLADENPLKLREIWRGVQVDGLFFDEMTGFEWGTFTYLMSRVRGTAKWTNKIRATLNPKKRHWTRTFLDWYIGADGFINPERDGRVRYFYIKGSTVESVVWGNSKREVYEQCKADIDKKLKRLGGNFSYEEMIKSFVFYEGKLSANKIMLKNNTGYLGNVASTGGKMAQQLIEGNFDADDDTDENIPITTESALEVFNNDPQTNGDRWITCDLADVGTDNTVALVWDGFHIIDMVTKSESTPRANAELLIQLAKKWEIGESHIIFDRNNAVYINDYIPEAQGFVSYYKSIGVDMFNYQSLKDECYSRLVWVINNGYFSFDKDIANRRYYHKKLKQDISVKTEFLDECSVVRFRLIPSGKKKLWSKEKMNEMLGNDRSMDLLDPCAMRMMPILQYNKGDELIKTSFLREEEKDIEYEQALYGDNDFSGFSM